MTSLGQRCAQGWEAVLGLIYPHNCQLCLREAAGPKEGFVGPQCWSGVRFIQPPFCERCGLPYPGDFSGPFECANCQELEFHFARARSAVEARGAVLEAIHRYKYQRALWFEPFLADLLIRAAQPELTREACHVIVPVPLHPRKQRERDFNQAARLADCLGRATGIPVNKALLRRVQFTMTQTKLSRDDRAENMRGAFAVAPGRRLQGERVVLLDDVFTTGATTSACAKVLRSAGAGEVSVWTVARGTRISQLAMP